MKIAIIGSGRIGAGLARPWTRRGHTVVFGARAVDDPELTALCASIGASAASIAEAARAAEVVVLAMPYAALTEVLALTGDIAFKLLRR